MLKILASYTKQLDLIYVDIRNDSGIIDNLAKQYQESK